MDQLPHHYKVAAQAGSEGAVELTTSEGARLQSDAPASFGGQVGVQSPEFLLAEALASCFILTFRAIASASNFPWAALQCTAEGVLDRRERKLCFTHFDLEAVLSISDESQQEKAIKLLEKAEANCLIGQSLSCTVELRPSINIGSSTG